MLPTKIYILNSADGVFFTVKVQSLLYFIFIDTYHGKF
jgi:hypothetical protein